MNLYECGCADRLASVVCYMAETPMMVVRYLLDDEWRLAAIAHRDLERGILDALGVVMTRDYEVRRDALFRLEDDDTPSEDPSNAT